MNNKAVLNAFSLIAQSDAIRRYSRDQLVVQETVLAHTGWCAMWCLFVGSRMEFELGIELDWGLLMCSCVAHDLDEIGTGDIPRTTKYANPTVANELQKVADSFIWKLEAELGLPRNKLGPVWARAKNPNRLEGLLLKQADLAAVVYKVWDEVTRHNNFAFVRVAHELRGFLEDLINSNVKHASWLGLSESNFLAELNIALITIVDCAISDSASRDGRLGPLKLTLE